MIRAGGRSRGHCIFIADSLIRNSGQQARFFAATIARVSVSATRGVIGQRLMRKQHIRHRHRRAQTALAASTPPVRHSSKTLASAFSVSICSRGPVPTTSLASVTMIRQASLLFATSYRGLLRRILRTSGLLAALTDRPSASPQCRRLWSDVLAESYFARSMRANRAPGLGLRDEASVRRTHDGMISRLREEHSS